MAAAAPAGPPPTTIKSNCRSTGSAFSFSSEPTRSSSLPRSSPRSPRPMWSSCPLAKTAGTACMFNRATSSWKSAPSIISLFTLLFFKAMMLSACTTSGQLVHVNDTYVCSLISPLRLAIRLLMASSGRFLPLPSALRTAKRSEVNSCPLGMPRKEMPTGCPSFKSEKDSCASLVSVKLADKCVDVDTKSFTNSFSSAASVREASVRTSSV